jgi:hypothetical protein
MPRHRLDSRSSTVESVLFQPWFLPKQVAFAIHELVPADFWNKMRHFFDDYGCMICGREKGYYSNGMCHKCNRVIRSKLLLSVKRHYAKQPRRRLDLELFRQEKLAKRLLGRFAARHRKPSRRRRSEMVLPHNPIYEALAARPEYIATGAYERRGRGPGSTL